MLGIPHISVILSLSLYIWSFNWKSHRMTSGLLYPLLQLVPVHKRSKNPCRPWLDAMENQGPDPCPSALHCPYLLLPKTLAHAPEHDWSAGPPSTIQEEGDASLWDVPWGGTSHPMKYFTRKVLEDLYLWESRLELNYTFHIRRWDRKGYLLIQ